MAEETLNQRPAINVNTANATVTARQLENIKGEKLLYAQIDTLKGRVTISIGEKNHKALTEILSK